jgi:hypothetical protein
MDPEYAEIARKRVEAVVFMKQMGLFEDVQDDAVFSAKGVTGVPVRVPSADLFNNDAARVAFEGRE